MVPTLMDGVAEAAPPDTRGVAIATWTGAARAGQTVGPLLAGVGLATAGSGASLVMVGGIAAVVFMLAVRRPWAG